MQRETLILFGLISFLLLLPLAFPAVVEITIEYGLLDWEIYPTSFGTRSGVVGTNVTLGVFKLNNTGTKTISFKLIPNQPWISFNVSSTFSLGVGEIKYIQVNATVPSQPGTYDYSIKVNATTPDVSPSYETITGSLIASTLPQPYVSVEIVNPPSSVSPGQQVSLSAKATNTGSGNATNAWLAWGLPSGWSLVSGSLNVSVTSLFAGGTFWNNITVAAPSSTGTYSFTVIGNSSEGFGSTHSASIQVSQPAGPTPGPGPGPTPGPTPAPTIKAWSYVIDTYIELFENETVVRNILVKNEGNVDLHNIRISVEGLETSWYSIQPSSYPRAIPGETKSFIISYSPTKSGTYRFKIKIISDELRNETQASLYVKPIPPPEISCGNGVCEPTESCETCPEDCGVCPKVIESRLELIKSTLIITGIIGPIVIAAYMFLLIVVKRCPICGGRLETTYKGKYVVSRKCTRCGYFEIKEAK